MSWRISSSVLVESNGQGEWWSKEYGPGEKVPVSGIYRCKGCKKEITSNANNSDVFPPQNHHQHTVSQGAIKWKLNIRTNTTGE